MKANKLMIGDWVRIVDDESPESFISKIEGIDSMGNVICTAPGDTIGYPYALECVKGIPLTAEILEKNGFAKEGCYYWVCSDEEYHIDFVWKNKCALGIGNNMAEKDDDIVCINNVTFILGWTNNIYVHEFQHALNLCDIDKEIIIQ